MTYTLQFKQLFRKKKKNLTVVSIQAAILPTTSRFDISRGSSRYAPLLQSADRVSFGLLSARIVSAPNVRSETESVTE